MFIYFYLPLLNSSAKRTLFVNSKKKKKKKKGWLQFPPLPPHSKVMAVAMIKKIFLHKGAFDAKTHRCQLYMVGYYIIKIKSSN
jgi:hypothetical protein